MMMVQTPGFQSRGPQQQNFGMIGRKIWDNVPIDFRSEIEDDDGQRILIDERLNAEVVVCALDRRYRGLMKMGKKDLVVGSWFLSGGGSKHRRAQERAELIPNVIDLRCNDGKFQDYLKALIEVNNKWSAGQKNGLVTSVPDYIEREEQHKQSLQRGKLMRKISTMTISKEPVKSIDSEEEEDNEDQGDSSATDMDIEHGKHDVPSTACLIPCQCGHFVEVCGVCGLGSAQRAAGAGQRRKSEVVQPFDMILGLRVEHEGLVGTVSRAERRAIGVAFFLKFDADGSEQEVSPENLRIALLACNDADFVMKRLTACEEKLKTTATPQKSKQHKKFKTFLNDNLGALPHPLAELLKSQA